MAFRIHDSIVRGEIDNRVKGIVRGKIWVEGRDGPIKLELRGNAHPDIAGCLLTFTNPGPRVHDPHGDSLQSLQRGTIGDLTASRKVRVFDVPLEEALAMIRRKEKPPEHMANCLYLTAPHFAEIRHPHYSQCQKTSWFGQDRGWEMLNGFSLSFVPYQGQTTNDQ